MLVVEHVANGRTVVRLHKDWHPGRISRAWLPPPQNNVTSGDAFLIQSAFINKFPTKRNKRNK